jgi:S-adenosylmethionine:tRNA ribosyltransferase-isomerase
MEKMDPRSIAISDYSYVLPQEKIAIYPEQERDASKLLVYENQHLTEDVFRNLPSHLPSNSLLVLNNTRVIEARMVFRKQSGGEIEIFCLEPIGMKVTEVLSSRPPVVWKALIGGASKWKRGLVLQKQIKISAEPIDLFARYVGKYEDAFAIELSWTPDTILFDQVLTEAGNIPLPPYLKRAVEELDHERYQTTFAAPAGSVAAPTAGLHFSHNVLNELSRKNIQVEYLTLHVGAGTFKPVTAATMSGHLMHRENFVVTRSFLNAMIQHEFGHVTAVGTTSLRTLESLYIAGCKLLRRQEQAFTISQWEGYDDHEETITKKDALSAILRHLEQNGIDEMQGSTELLIAPSYPLRMADALVTNFHQPASTLLLLVAAFAGPGWKEMYEYAINHDFRFLSYGDGCLIMRGNSFS